MGQETLVEEEVDAAADFIRDFDEYAPVTVALWVQESESGNFYLYVAYDGGPLASKRDAYGVVLKKINALKNPWLDPFKVKLIDSTDSIAKAAISIRDSRPATIATNFHGSSLGGLPIEFAKIYPKVSAMKAAS